MNRKGFTPILLLLIVVGVLVIGGGVWYWKDLVILLHLTNPSAKIEGNNISIYIPGYQNNCPYNFVSVYELNNNARVTFGTLPDCSYSWNPFFADVECHRIEPIKVELKRYLLNNEGRYTEGPDGHTIYAPVNGDIEVNAHYFTDRDCKNATNFSTVVKR